MEIGAKADLPHLLSKLCWEVGKSYFRKFVHEGTFCKVDSYFFALFVGGDQGRKQNARSVIQDASTLYAKSISCTLMLKFLPLKKRV